MYDNSEELSGENKEPTKKPDLRDAKGIRTDINVFKRRYSGKQEKPIVNI